MGCTRGNSRLESLYDEPYISDAHDMNLEEQLKMTLQDDETLQHDNNEMHTLKSQLEVSEDMVAASLVCYDNTHKMVEDLYRKAQREGKRDWLVADLQVVKTALETMKSNYLRLLRQGLHS